MKTCLICYAVCNSKADTCPNCGNATWEEAIAMPPKEEPPPVRAEKPSPGKRGR